MMLRVGVHILMWERVLVKCDDDGDDDDGKFPARRSGALTQNNLHHNTSD